MQVKALNCPNCGASIPDTSTACSHCGSKVILSDDRMKFVLAGKICPKCGTENKEVNRHCSSCGNALFKICRNLDCRKEIYLSDIHCPYCGYSEEMAEREETIRHAENSISSGENYIKDATNRLRDLRDRGNDVPDDTEPLIGCLVLFGALFAIISWGLFIGQLIQGKVDIGSAIVLGIFCIIISWVVSIPFSKGYKKRKKVLDDRKEEIAQLEKNIAASEKRIKIEKSQLQNIISDDVGNNLFEFKKSKLQNIFGRNR